MPSLVDRYLLAEIAKVFVAIMVTLMLVMSSMLFLRSLEQVNVGALTSDLLLRFLGLQILRDTASLLPPAFFIAALVALGRMARDSELIAFHACGLGPVRIYRSLLLLALPLALLTAWFSLALQPYASARIQLIEDSQGDQAAKVSGLQAGRFYQQEDGDITFYATELDAGKRFRDVFIQDRRQDPPRVVLGESAMYQESARSGERAVVLERGSRFDGAAGSAEYGIADFSRYTYYLSDDGNAVGGRRRRSAQPTSQLIGSSSLADRAEIGHRLSAPVGIFALALLAIPLTTLSPRQRGGGRMFLAFLAYFAFFNLQRLAVSWMEAGVTPAWMGVLWYQAFIVVLVYAALLPGSFWARRRLRWPSRRGIRGAGGGLDG
ncbi:MAG: LPS export ABC transporter permease LptF [Thiohalocapsa sp.]|nr:LPS export ABC transporter permease LptF [Thiohalocapsa sp.]